MAHKYYATRMTLNGTCMMAKDYSVFVGSACLKCQFCYKYLKPIKRKNGKDFLSSYIDREYELNKELFMAPIFISRYCEPFLTPSYTRQSLYVAKRFIENKSQVIFNTYGKNLDHPDVFSFIKENKNSVQLQLRVFNYDKEISNIIKSTLCPNVPSIKDSLSVLSKYDFVDRCIVIDPFIVGINDIDAIKIIEDAHSIGVKKVIIKQLFATNYFKNYLNKFIGKRDYLTQKAGVFWTYDNTIILKSLIPILALCEKLKVDVSMCFNKEINGILNIKYNNCCMLENPIGIYRTENQMLRINGESLVIKLKRE